MSDGYYEGGNENYQLALDHNKEQNLQEEDQEFLARLEEEYARFETGVDDI